MKIDQEDV